MNKFNIILKNKNKNPKEEAKKQWQFSIECLVGFKYSSALHVKVRSWKRVKVFCLCAFVVFFLFFFFETKFKTTKIVLIFFKPKFSEHLNLNSFQRSHLLVRVYQSVLLPPLLCLCIFLNDFIQAYVCVWMCVHGFVHATVCFFF